MCDKQAYTYVRSLGTCIKRDTTLSSFADARASCHVEGGSLLEVKTNATKLYIKQIMLDITGKSTKLANQSKPAFALGRLVKWRFACGWTVAYLDTHIA